MYVTGKGVTQDYIRGYMWANIAVLNGIQEALNNRDVAAKQITPQQIEEAQELAKKCITNKYKGCD